MAQLRLVHASPPSVSRHRHLITHQTHPFSPLPTLRLNPNPSPTLSLSLSSGGGGGGGDRGNGGDRGGGGGGDDDLGGGVGPLGPLMKGWRSRVAADPEFPFKVLMEEVVGVSACVAGDMACRPNFGLDELDLVFSTVVVGCMVNFVLMYLLAPTAGPKAAAAALPWIFANCPKSHMFEPGGFGFVSRLGTFVYKGAVFSAVGFGAGLAGTALSNGVIGMRKRVDPRFETRNEPPPTLLNAATWAVQMGVSSNLRYQTLNGVEFFMARSLPPPLFKASVVILRCLNNVLGGMTFVTLARITGSQSGGGSGRRGGSSGSLTDTSSSEDDPGSLSQRVAAV